MHGDCAQTIQLCAAMEYVDKKDTVVKPLSLLELNELLTIDTSKISIVSSFHGDVQSLFKDAISLWYGCYNCVTLPLGSEKEVGVLLYRFNSSFPYHRTGSQALLNISQKQENNSCGAIQ